MSAKANKNSLLYRIIAVFMIAMLLLAAMPAPAVQAAPLRAVGTLTAWTRTAGTTGPFTIANGTFSCAAGTNRLLVAVVTAEYNNTPAVMTLTATKGAGVNFTQAVKTTNSTRTGVWIGYLTEAQIAGNANSIVITESGAGAWQASDVYLACFSGVNQTTPVVAGGTAQNSSDTNTGSYTFNNVPAVSTGMMIYGAGHNSNNNAITQPTGYTEPFDANSNNDYRTTLGFKASAAATESGTITFGGNSRYAAAVVSLNPAAVLPATTTTITADTPEPSLAGQQVAVTVTVTGGATTPTGTVSITGANTNCNITLAAGTGSCNVTFTTTGAKTLTATYSGDATHAASTDTEPHTVNALPATTTTITADTPDPSVTGQQVAVAVTVTGGAATPTGTVSITGANTNCNITLDAAGTGSCNVTFTTTGAKTLTATYNGDATHATSTDTEPHTVATATYTINASAGANGTIMPIGAIAVAGGANQTFSSAPSPNYILSDVLVDGVSAGRRNSYTFNAVNANHTIAASFNGGWLAPTATANVLVVPNPNDGFTSNNTSASFSSLGERVDYTTFNIPALPAGTTINGIEVAVEGYCATVDRNLEISISWNGGTNYTAVTAARTTSILATESTLILGGSADTWGRTWSNTEFTNANFRVRTRSLGGGTSSVYLDQIQVRVNYTLPAAAPNITSANATTFTAGIAGNFSVIATGSPVPTFTATGALPTGVTLSAAGVLSGSPAAGTVGSYPITITASNGVSPDATQSFTLTVQKANTTTTISSDLPDPSSAGENVVINYAVAAAGNTITPTGNVTVGDGVNTCVGTVAAGTCTLALNTAGARTLTATYAGDANFNGSASAGATHTVNTAPPTITSAAPANGTQGVAYTHTYTATGTTPITFTTSDVLPAGLTLTPAGVLSGTPTVLGTFTGTVTASNGVVPNATQDFSITISLSPNITSANNTSFSIGTAGTFTVTATGSPAPTLSMTGALPSGVNFVPATGVLSGTPASGTSGTYPLTFTAANGTLPDAVQNFTLTVTEGPSITSADHVTFSLGLPGTFTVTAVGSPAPTLSVVGTLPTGVTFDPVTGILSGTPAAGMVGTHSLIFNAANGTLPNAHQDFTLTVKNGPIVMPSGVNSVPDTGNGSISENESVLNTLGITKLKVKFDQDVLNVPGSHSDFPKSVINPANYMLVMGSSTGVFQTVSCSGNVQAPDVAIAVDSVTYTNGAGFGPFVATLNINGGLPLNAVGYYRLYVCGTTSIVDATNTNLELAGNGTTPGTDFILNFRLQSTVTTGSGSGDGSNASKKKDTFSPSTTLIPVTGFAPNKITALPDQPANKAYKSLGEIRIEIPTLGINYPIVGAALSENTWDLTWLKDGVAYLEGSAYPTLPGNTVLTAHVVDANNNLGPFSDIKGMKSGQKIYVHAYGQVYVYQVQENKKISPTNISTVFKHEEYSWITLVTCEDYDAKSKSYQSRRMVRAVLISVVPEK